MKAFVFYIVGLCFFSVKLYAYEFQNFKVDQKHLQQRQKQVASAATGTLSRSNSSSILKLQSFTPTLESDSDMESPLMQEIHSYLEQEFVSLSEEQRQVLWERGRRFDLGVKNFSGLTWQKPMGEYLLYVDRQILPSATNDLWVATDRLVVAIKATTYLKSLQQQGVVEISGAQLAAFAGLEFRRVYEYHYYVNDYDQALSQNMDRLFLSFLHFVKPSPFLLSPGDRLKKSDVMGWHVGAKVNVPLQSQLSLTAGALVQGETLSSVEMMRSFDSDPSVGVQLLKQKTKRVGVELSLNLDFLNLLKITLLGFEYQYSSTESLSQILVFNSSDRSHLMLGSPVYKDLTRLLRFFKWGKNLEDFTKYKEDLRSVKKTHQFHILGQGSRSSERSQYSDLLSVRGEKRTLLQHQSDYMRFTRGFKQTLLSLGFSSVSGLGEIIGFKTLEQKSVDLQYSQGSTGSEFQWRFEQQFYVENVSKKQSRKKALKFLESFGQFDPQVVSVVKQKKLKKSLQVSVVGWLSPQAISHFESLSDLEVDQFVRRHCPDPPLDSEDLLAGLQTKRARNSCYRRGIRSYEKYMKVVQGHKSEAERIWALKDFVTFWNQQAHDYKDLHTLWGEQGVYLTGVLSGRTKSGEVWTTYFRKGVPLEMGLEVRESLIFDSGAGSAMSWLVRP